jgi:hypothetical protein
LKGVFSERQAAGLEKLFINRWHDNDVDRLDKTIGAGIKSNVRCCDVSDEWMGSYDASFLIRFQPSNSTRKNISIRLEWSD